MPRPTIAPALAATGVLVALLGAACDAGADGRAPADAQGDARPAASLVDLAAFVAQPPQADPFGDLPDAPCADSAWGLEDGLFEIATDGCGALSVVQPSLVAVRAGDRVHVVAWHLGLYAPEPAEAHVGLALGEAVLWEARVPVPSAEAFFDETVTVGADAPEGTPLTLHLHNHGANSWRLLTVERVP